jgi:hypothetical protein
MDDPLAQPSGHLLGHDARDDVRSATGREGHDHGDGTGGVGVLRADVAREDGDGEQNERHDPGHGRSPEEQARPDHSGRASRCR